MRPAVSFFCGSPTMVAWPPASWKMPSRTGFGSDEDVTSMRRGILPDESAAARFIRLGFAQYQDLEP